jgi:hypothetical protein
MGLDIVNTGDYCHGQHVKSKVRKRNYGTSRAEPRQMGLGIDI